MGQLEVILLFIIICMWLGAAYVYGYIKGVRAHHRHMMAVAAELERQQKISQLNPNKR